LRYETRNACFDHCIKSLSDLNAIDFVQRIFRKGGDIKILFRTAFLDVVSKAVPRCTPHASSTCAGVFPTRAAIAKMTGSSSGPGFMP